MSKFAVTGGGRLVSCSPRDRTLSSPAADEQLDHLYPSPIDKLAFCINLSHCPTALDHKPSHMAGINIRNHPKSRRKQLLRIGNPPLTPLDLLQNGNIVPHQKLLIPSLNKTVIHLMKTPAKSSRCNPLRLSSSLNLLQKLGPYKRFMGSVYGHANEELDLFAREWD